MALIDDMLTNSTPIDVEFRGATYRVNYKPLALTDQVKAQLDEMMTRFQNGTTGDMTGIDPLLLSVLDFWEIDEIVRNAQGQPLAEDGSILVDRATQIPRVQRMPVTAENLKRLATFLKLAIAMKIVNDAIASAGNAVGTSNSTPPADGSAARPGVPQSGTSVPSTLPAHGQNLPPALVTVPSLESRSNSV